MSDVLDLTQCRVLGEVRQYGDIPPILRARVAELAITHETLDDVSGNQHGYSSKLLAKIPEKHFGHVSMGNTLGALGLKLLVVEDPDALALVRNRLVKRKHPPAKRQKSVSKTAVSRHLRKIGKRGALALSREELSSAGRKGAAVRWGKRRRRKEHNIATGE